MGPLRVASRGFQQITALSAAVGLTLPVGAQQAQATSCSLAGKLLTVGGTLTGAFSIGQIVQGTGIPANTYITGPAGASKWLLSNSSTTESGETVTGYTPLDIDFAVISAVTQNVYWRDDGTAPTATIGMPMLTTSAAFEYYGDLTAIQFIQVSASAVLNVAYYKIVG